VKSSAKVLYARKRHLLSRPAQEPARDYLCHYPRRGQRPRLSAVARINKIPGVDIPISRLELRLSYGLDLLATDAGIAAAIGAQRWFLDQLAK
jgi:hypothetical protein